MSERVRLAELGQIYVTLAVARDYARARGLQEEEARRELTVRLVAHGRVTQPAIEPGATVGVRARSRTTGVDIAARVIREADDLLVVVAVQVRRA